MSKRQYSAETMEKAAGDVKCKKLNPYQAAREYNVPRSTICDKVKEKYKKSSKGPSKMLSEEEESSLVEYINHMSTRGFPITRKMLKSHVVAIVKESGRDTLLNLDKGPSDKWCRNFFRRYPLLAERTPEAQDKARFRMSNWTVMKQYFTLLEDTVKNLELKDKPSQIFNCDETGFSGKEKSKQKVIVNKGTYAYQQRNLTNSHITFLICVAGDGRVLPTYLIFEGSLPHRNFREGVPANWLYGSSDSGYMDSELFELWFEKIFIPFCGSRRPVLLTFDNHDSHISLSLLKLSISHDIHIIGLPPHTTHILQPLDVDICGPLKEKLASLATVLGYLSSNVQIGKAKFPALLSTAIDSVCSPARVKAAFRKPGMYPVDIGAVDKTQIQSQTDASEKNKETTSSNSDSRSIQIVCDKCGESMDVDVCSIASSTNPFVRSGLIPEKLGAILVPPMKSQQLKRAN
ncbi:uncharacterized protein LOC134229974 [Saccostrea cucullata]|uniref:uncharacterized protein LOC134229974 n=1 Tax=Saccostrea cuccullata TaxID=36930 RepID=UPI002ED36495